MNLICLLASVAKENSVFDFFMGIFLGLFVFILIMWFSMVLFGMKIRLGPDPEWAKEAKKYNEKLVERRPWIVWVIMITSFGSFAGTTFWYLGKIPFVN